MNLSPLPIQKFFGNNGRPLDGGKLFTYEAGTSNKIATYTDASGSQQNTNPIILNFRGEANVWLDPELSYKFVLSPANDTDPPTEPIWSVDQIESGITISELTQQFIGRILYPLSSEEITAGAIPVNYWYPYGYVRRYGAIGNGIANDRAAILAAFKVSALGGGDLVFDPLTYYVGTEASDNAIFDSVSVISSVVGMRIRGRGATLTMQTVGVFNPTLIRLTNPQDCEIDGLKCIDTGVNLSVPNGMIAFQLYAMGSGTYYRTSVTNCSTDGADAFFQVTGDANSQAGIGAAIEGVSVDASCVAKNTFYGISTQITCAGLQAVLQCMNVGRTYFPYGASGHNVTIYAQHDGSPTPAANACCLIDNDAVVTSIGNRLQVYFSQDVQRWGFGVGFQFKTAIGAMGLTKGWNVYVNTQSVTNFGAFVPFSFRAFDLMNNQLLTTDNQWTDITLDGNLDNFTANADILSIFTTQNSRGSLHIQPGLWKLFNATSPFWPGFGAHLRPDSITYTLTGDIPSQTLDVPMPTNGVGFIVKVSVIATNSAAVTHNTTLCEDAVVGYGAAGSVTFQSFTTIFSEFRLSELTRIYSASGANLRITFSGAAYAVAGGYARVDVSYTPRAPSIV